MKKKILVILLLFYILFGVGICFSSTPTPQTKNYIDTQDHTNVDPTQPHIHTQNGPIQIHEVQPSSGGTSQSNVVLWSVVSSLIVGSIMLVATYFMKKGEKVDDIASIYATKSDLKDIRDKLDIELKGIKDKADLAISKDACKNMRNDCAGKNWADSFKRMEDTFNSKLDAFDRKFDELNSLLLEVMKEIGYYKGRSTAGQTSKQNQE